MPLTGTISAQRSELTGPGHRAGDWRVQHHMRAVWAHSQSIQQITPLVLDSKPYQCRRHKTVASEALIIQAHLQLCRDKLPWERSLSQTGECESRAGLYLKASEVGGERNLAAGRSHVLEHVSLGCLPLCKDLWRLGSGLMCCCCSFPKLYLTCDPMDYSTPGFPVFHCLLEFAQIHVH